MPCACQECERWIRSGLPANERDKDRCRVCKRVPCVLSLYACRINEYVFPAVWADAARETEKVGWAEAETTL